ncbi:hypothetical protein BJY59DRAFT_254189 [Rhodotorula toruloides]
MSFSSSLRPQGFFHFRLRGFPCPQWRFPSPQWPFPPPEAFPAPSGFSRPQWLSPAPSGIFSPSQVSRIPSGVLSPPPAKRDRALCRLQSFHLSRRGRALPAPPRFLRRRLAQCKSPQQRPTLPLACPSRTSLPVQRLDPSRAPHFAGLRPRSPPACAYPLDMSGRAAAHEQRFVAPPSETFSHPETRVGAQLKLPVVGRKFRFQAHTALLILLRMLRQRARSCGRARDEDNELLLPVLQSAQAAC